MHMVVVRFDDNDLFRRFPNTAANMHIKQIRLISFSIADNRMFQHRGKWCQKSAASVFWNDKKAIFPSYN